MVKPQGRLLDPARELNGQGRMLPAGQLGRFRTELAEHRAALEAATIPEVAETEPADTTPTAPDPGAMD